MIKETYVILNIVTMANEWRMIIARGGHLFYISRGTKGNFPISADLKNESSNKVRALNHLYLFFRMMRLVIIETGA